MPQREKREQEDPHDPLDQQWRVRIAQESADAVPNLEHMARDIGRRWGLRMRAEQLAPGDNVGNWPGTLDQARTLVDSALQQPLPHEERELLAMLVERGARRAWHAVPDAQ
jgi:hypothetical protein